MAAYKNNKMQLDKVLIITHHFIPSTHSLGGIARVLGLIFFLRTKKIDTYILAAKGKFQSYFGYKKEIKNLNISHIYDPVKFIYDYLLDRNSKSLIGEPRHKRLEIILNFMVTFKKNLRNLIIPDLVIFSLPIYFIRALFLIKNKNIKYIFISSPPHSLAIVGYLLKLIYRQKIILILDYRDSWNMTNLNSSNFSFVNKINFFLEKLALEKCDFFVYASKPMLTKLISKLNFDLKKKSILMLNGFTKEPNKRPKIKVCSRKINIGYFGSLSTSENSYRNINLFLDMIVNLRLEERFNIHIYGSYSKYNFASYGPLINLHGNLDHTEALNNMAKMDYLLLIHTDPKNSDEVITGKFFDYISAERPIISFSPSNMEANRLILKYNLGYFININNKSDTVFKKLMPRERFALSKVEKKFFHRDVQYKKMIHFILNNQPLNNL